MENKLKEAIDTLVEALQTDEGYRIGWQANIAMSFKDEYSRNKLKYKNRQDIHKIANTASDNFLNMLCAQKEK